MKAATKLQLVTSHVPCAVNRQADIDRLGVLHAILADYAVQIAPYEAEADALEAKLLESYAKSPADQMFVEESPYYRLRVGACADQQQLDIPARLKVFKIIGKEAYVTLSKPTFEALKSALTPAQYEAAVRKERTGKRSLKVVVKAAPEPIRAVA